MKNTDKITKKLEKCYYDLNLKVTGCHVHVIAHQFVSETKEELYDDRDKTYRNLVYDVLTLLEKVSLLRKQLKDNE